MSAYMDSTNKKPQLPRNNYLGYLYNLNFNFMVESNMKSMKYFDSL